MTTVNVMHGHTVRTEAKSPTETSVEFDGVAVGTYPTQSPGFHSIETYADHLVINGVTVQMADLAEKAGVPYNPPQRPAGGKARKARKYHTMSMVNTGSHVDMYQVASKVRTKKGGRGVTMVQRNTGRNVVNVQTYGQTDDASLTVQYTPHLGCGQQINAPFSAGWTK